MEYAFDTYHGPTFWMYFAADFVGETNASGVAVTGREATTDGGN